jgi:hypothetical protein
MEVHAKRHHSKSGLGSGDLVGKGIMSTSLLELIGGTDTVGLGGHRDWSSIEHIGAGGRV